MSVMEIVQFMPDERSLKLSLFVFLRRLRVKDSMRVKLVLSGLRQIWVPDWLAKFLFNKCRHPIALDRMKVKYVTLDILNSLILPNWRNENCDGCIAESIVSLGTERWACCSCKMAAKYGLISMVAASRLLNSPEVFTTADLCEILSDFDIYLENPEAEVYEVLSALCETWKMCITTPFDPVILLIESLRAHHIWCNTNILFSSSIYFMNYVTLYKKEIYSELAMWLTAGRTATVPGINPINALIEDGLLLASAVVVASISLSMPIPCSLANVAVAYQVVEIIHCDTGIPRLFINTLASVIVRHREENTTMQVFL